MDRVYIKAYSKGKLFDISLFYLECTVALQIKGPQCDYLSKEVMLFDTFPKMAVVVNKKALGILLSQWAVRGDILTFVSTPGSNSRGGVAHTHLCLCDTRTFVRFPFKKTKSPRCAMWMNTSFVCVCVLPCPTDIRVSHQIIVFPFFSPKSSFTYVFLPGTLMILKSACSYNASYIDRLISVFMRSLQKMVREHLSPQQANPGVAETSTGTRTDVNSVGQYITF